MVLASPLFYLLSCFQLPTKAPRICKVKICYDVVVRKQKPNNLFVSDMYQSLSEVDRASVNFMKNDDNLSEMLKFRYCEKATKFEKKSPTCFDVKVRIF